MIQMIQPDADMATSPLTEFPVFGPVMRVADDMLLDTGMPLWGRGVLELGAIVVVAFIVLRWLTRTVVPWLGGVLAEPMARVFEALRAVLLVPELLVSRALRSRGVKPPEVLYSYGAVVVSVTEEFEKWSTRGLPALAATKRIPRAVLIVAVALAFVLWNHSSCDSEAGQSCVTPVGVWKVSLADWVAKQ